MRDTQKIEYQKIIDTLEDVPIFYESWWLDAVWGHDSWSCSISYSKGGVPTGVWPYKITKKWMLDLSFHPPFTPILGPYIMYPLDAQKPNSKLTFEKKVLSDLCDNFPQNLNFLKIKCHPSFENWLPLYWKGWTQTTNYTYQVPLLDMIDLMGSYQTSIRTDIKKIPADVSVEKIDTFERMNALAKNSFVLQDASEVFNESTFIKLDKELSQRGLRDIYIAKDKNNIDLAGIYTFRSHKTTYLPLIGRRDLKGPYTGLVKWLLHQAILEAQQSGQHTFDFEGSMIENFERVFRAMGGHQVPYFVISRMNNPLLKIFFSLRN